MKQVYKRTLRYMQVVKLWNKLLHFYLNYIEIKAHFKQNIYLDTKTKILYTTVMQQDSLVLPE